MEFDERPAAMSSPIFFDGSKDREHVTVQFEVDVTCSDCVEVLDNVIFDTIRKEISRRKSNG